jgi:hypothetical protein
MRKMSFELDTASSMLPTMPYDDTCRVAFGATHSLGQRRTIELNG